jgi:hypothetical protein
MRPIRGNAYATLRHFVALLFFFVAGCSYTTRVDESVVFATPKLRVRVVRNHAHRPFDNIGYEYQLQCAATGSTRWTTITEGSLDESSNAKVVAKQMRLQFQLFGDDILVWNFYGQPRIASPGCAPFREWSAASVNPDLIDPAPIWPRDHEPRPLESKPWNCAEPEVDCRRWEFEGNRRLSYENLSVHPDGTITFDAVSRAFHDGRVHVESHDWGKIWIVRRPSGEISRTPD